jgi:Fur family ferric uptake transcriptional regulator
MPAADPPPSEQARYATLEALCLGKKLRMTHTRRVILKALACSHDHPNAEILHARAAALDPQISIATVYRTVRLLEDVGILLRHSFGDGKGRYEPVGEAHNHLIDVESGRVIEFADADLETLQQAVARRLGYRLVDVRLELFGTPAKTGGDAV